MVSLSPLDPASRGAHGMIVLGFIGASKSAQRGVGIPFHSPIWIAGVEMLGGGDRKERQNGYLLFVVHDSILC